MGIIEGILATLGGGTLLIGIGILFIIVMFFMAITRVLKFIRKVPPNKALLVYGVRTKTRVNVVRRVRKPKQVSEESGEKNVGAGGQVSDFETRTEEVIVNYRIVKGGMTIVLPLVHEVRELDLSLVTLDVATPNVLSLQAVPITVDGIAQIKIGSDDTSIATAAEQLLDKTPEEVKYVAIQTLQGHLRAIIGLMTVEDVYMDREAFSQRVLEVAVDDLAGMGLQIVSFVIKEISDEKGYLEALGRPEIANKLRDARQAEAKAEQEATEKEQAAEKQKAGFTKEAEVAKAQYNAEVSRERAVAERSQAISLAEQDKTLEERKAGAALAAAARRDKELDAEERRPADAKLYTAEKVAEATKVTGFAEAAVTQKTGEAEAAANQAKGIADANVTEAKGKAEGAAIEARLLAEAKGKKELAESLNAYNPGALRLVLGDKLLGGIPAVAESFGKAFANIEQIRLIEIGGGPGAPGEGTEGAVQRFLDTLPNTMFKFLQGATALLAGPIDDLVAAYIIEEAEKRGLKVAPEKKEIIKEIVSAKMAEAKAEVEAEEAATQAKVEAEVETPVKVIGMAEALEVTLAESEIEPPKAKRRPRRQKQ
ncbi:MAG: SPFH domain-containing protein [Candidatus Marinimicrobia bacterium]|nr:SPFH domain-containing protein [Candidatus Neomarinimicrobiota bacterium]